MNPATNDRRITASGGSCDQEVIRALETTMEANMRPSQNQPLNRGNGAEGEGFEPSRPLRAYPLSRRAHSAGLCDPSGAGEGYEGLTDPDNRRQRRSAKNRLRRSPHSSASTPRITSGWWLRRSSRGMSHSDSTAPAFGSVAP